MHKSYLFPVLAASLFSMASVSLTACFGGGGEGECVPVTADSVMEADNGVWVRMAPTAAPGAAELVHYANDQTGYAAGTNYLKTNPSEGDLHEESVLHKTTNGGQSWFPVQVPLTSVRFFDASTGWAVGTEGVILKTNNGGNTWESQASGTRRTLSSVHYVNATTAYVAGDSGLILKTTNGGTAWAAQASGTPQRLNMIQFMNANIGVAVGENGVIVLTSNGGSVWKKPVSPTKYHLQAVHFRDVNNGWAVGWGSESDKEAPIITLKSTNGGKAWTKVASTTDLPAHSVGRVSAVQFTGAATGWALVDVFQGIGYVSTLMKTTNGGVNWSVNRQIPDVYIYNRQPGSFFFIDSSNGWYTNGATLLITHNAGQSWSQSNATGSHRPASIHFATATTGYAVGAGGTVYKTSNGGTAWTLQRGGLPLEVRALSFPDPGTGWALGSAGVIAKTTDGGVTWATQSSGTTEHLRGAHFMNVQEGYAVGTGGTILRTENGGTTWAPQTSGTSATLWSVRFTSASEGFAVGDGGTILRTTNWGESWVAQSSGTNKNLQGVTFVDAITGWAVGGGVGQAPYSSLYIENAYWARGVILKTSNAGETWVVQDTSALKLYAVHFVNAGTGYAVGGGPTYIHFPTPIGLYDSYCSTLSGYYSQVLKTTNGGATWVAERTRLQTEIESPNSLRGGAPFLSVSCGPSGQCAAVGAQGVWRRP